MGSNPTPSAEPPRAAPAASSVAYVRSTLRSLRPLQVGPGRFSRGSLSAVPSAGNDTNWVVKRISAKPLTARRAALVISVFTLTLTVIAATSAFLLDRDDFPNLGISMWWALQTVTTVGYGDFVPHNTEGRIIGSLVMLGGISFAAVVTASIAAALIEAARRRGVGGSEREDRLSAKLDEISARLERLEEAVKRPPQQ